MIRIIVIIRHSFHTIFPNSTSYLLNEAQPSVQMAFSISARKQDALKKPLNISKSLHDDMKDMLETTFCHYISTITRQDRVHKHECWGRITDCMFILPKWRCLCWLGHMIHMEHWRTQKDVLHRQLVSVSSHLAVRPKLHYKDTSKRHLKNLHADWTHWKPMSRYD